MSAAGVARALGYLQYSGNRMSSKRRERRKSCDGKVRHATLEAAKLAARKASSGSVGKLWAYKCKFCKNYHIGHPPKDLLYYMIKRRGYK